MELQSRPMYLLPFGLLPLATQVTGKAAEMAWLDHRCGQFFSSLTWDFINSLFLGFHFLDECNDLEELLNREREGSGVRPLHCDAIMRMVAYSHLDDADEAAKKNLAWQDECNIQSWLVKFPCCYTGDGENAECMWNKPYVSCIRPQMYSQTNGNI